VRERATDELDGRSEVREIEQCRPTQRAYLVLVEPEKKARGIGTAAAHVPGTVRDGQLERLPRRFDGVGRRIHDAERLRPRQRQPE